MNPYLKLAKDSIKYYLDFGKKMPLPKDLAAELLTKRAGVFVSLHRQGQLRGCIGTIEATTASIAAEIIQNALSAAFDDPRFPPLTKEELADLEINVDVLNEAIPVKSIKELDVKKFGVIVESGYKRGLLLPDIDGVDTVIEQIQIACQKAGLDPGEKYDLYKFTVTRHEET